MTCNTFNSTDIYLCAYLVSHNVRLRGVERDHNGRAHFYLESNEGLDALVQRYWSGKPVPVIPAQLFAALKHLKGLLHSTNNTFTQR